MFKSGRGENIKFIELGAGVGLPSLTVSSLQYICTATDCSLYPHVLENLRYSLSLNPQIPESKCKIMSLDWGSSSASSQSIAKMDSFDVILGADVFYDPLLFESLLQTISLFFQKNPNCVFVTAYQERSAKRTLTPLLEQYNMKGELVECGYNLMDLVSEYFVFKQATSVEELKEAEYSDSSMASVFIFKITLKSFQD